MGISPASSNDDDGRWLNSKNWIVIINLTMWFLSSVTFIFFGANSMFEYGKSSFGASVAFFVICEYLAMIKRKEHTRSLIGNLEKFMEKSE